MGFTLGTKFNDGTDWEFRVSNETLAEVVTGGGITEADIKDYCYCAFVDKRVAALVPESTRNSNDGLYPWAQEYCPVYNTNNGSHPSELKMNVDVLDDNKVECYERNILTYYGTIGGKTGHFLVMDIHDIKKWIIDCDASGAFSSTVVTSTAGFNGINDTIYLYDTNNVPQVNPLNAPAGTTSGLYPCNIVNIDSTLWVGFFTPIAHSKNLLFNEKLSHASWEFDYAAGDTFNVNSAGYVYQGDATTLQGWCEFQDLEFPTSSGTTTTFTTYIDADGFNIIRILGQYGNSGNAFITNAEMGNMFKTLKAMHTVQSWGGFLFYDNGVTYKPIIESGIVVGFTSDMDIPSEWDDMTNVTGNNISPTPPGPGPGPDGDDFDDHEMGAGSGISGMANLWLLTASQLADLHAACNSAPVGFDPLNSFISVMGIATNPEYLTHEIQYITPINIRMSDGTSWYTHVEGHIVDSQVSAFQFTGIRVEKHYNNFLDYSPYATHEIFVPMCGWLTLPDIAVDRLITVTYLPDIESLKCRCVVSVVDNSGHRCVVGEKEGIMGADVPFTNTGHSLYVGESIVNGAEIAGETITMAIGANYTKTGAKGKTFRPYEGFTLGGAGTLPGAIGNAFVSGNLNRTRFLTGNGTRVGFSDGENIQIKSTYHRVDIPDNYAHTVGLVCNMTGELSEFTGFTVCDNPHITFSALEAEKEEIKRLLEEGVIL